MIAGDNFIEFFLLNYSILTTKTFLKNIGIMTNCCLIISTIRSIRILHLFSRIRVKVNRKIEVLHQNPILSNERKDLAYKKFKSVIQILSLCGSL